MQLMLVGVGRGVVGVGLQVPVGAGKSVVCCCMKNETTDGYHWFADEQKSEMTRLLYPLCCFAYAPRFYLLKNTLAV